MPRFGELLIPLQSARLVAFALLVCAYERGPRNEVNVTWQGLGAADLWYVYNYIPYIIRLRPFVDTGHPGKRGALHALLTPWPDVNPADSPHNPWARARPTSSPNAPEMPPPHSPRARPAL